jgi:hypothetical protein
MAKSWSKRKSRSGQEALLSAIWESLGGITAVAKLLGRQKQIAINWRNRAAVPLSICPEVAKQLGLTKLQLLGLNYLGVSNYIPKPVPSWETVVKSFRLTQEVEDLILSLPSPKKE